jgi:micrococcal nuclease
MNLKILTGIFVIGIVLASIYFTNLKYTVTVSRVIDGDTIEIEGGERIRLLGIDTPERGQPLFKESTEFLEKLIKNKPIILETDIINRDKYGRLLRYIYIGDKFVNLELVKAGYAVTHIILPNKKYSEILLKAETEAKHANIGIWKFMNLTDIFCVGIYHFHYNAKGNDNENLNDEYVTFRNKCNYTINMSNWILKDTINTTYTFPEFYLMNKSMFTLYTGPGKNNSTHLYWNNNRAIWNNAGDILYLWNSNGILMLNYSY